VEAGDQGGLTTGHLRLPTAAQFNTSNDVYVVGGPFIRRYETDSQSCYGKHGGKHRALGTILSLPLPKNLISRNECDAHGLDRSRIDA
jgi:hypothetical protein